MAYKFLDEEPKEKKNSFLQSALRTPGLVLSGAAAPVAGQAGDIGSLITSLGGFPGKYEETAGKYIPTTEQSLKGLQEFEAFKPKNEYEKMVQNIAKDTVSLFLPGKIFKAGKYALGGLRSLGISLASHMVGKGVEGATGEESKGDLAKNGSMFFLSFINPNSAKNVVDNLYSGARNILPQGASVDASKLFNSLAKIETQVRKGRPLKNLAPTEKFVIDETDKILDLIKNGRIPIEQAVAQKKSLNENLAKHVYEAADKGSKTRVKQLAKQLNGSLRESLEEYGKTNPEWWKLQKSADEASSAIYQSNYVSRVLEKYLKGKPEMISHLFGVAAPIGVGKVAGGPISALGAAGYQSAKIIHRMLKSKELSKHYSKVIEAAFLHNPKAIKHALDSFQNQLDKEEKKHPSKYRFID